MSSRYKYTVEVFEPSNPIFPVARSEQSARDFAIVQARKYAVQYPENYVYISFFRAADGQKGYINPDGADITGKSWTTEN